MKKGYIDSMKKRWKDGDNSVIIAAAEQLPVSEKEETEWHLYHRKMTHRRGYILHGNMLKNR